MWGDTPESRQLEDISDLRRLFGEESYIEIIEEEWIQEDWNVGEEEEREKEEEEEQEQKDEEEEREREENEEEHEEDEEREEEWIDRCFFFYKSYCNYACINPMSFFCSRSGLPSARRIAPLAFQERPPPYPLPYIYIFYIKFYILY